LTFLGHFESDCYLLAGGPVSGLFPDQNRAFIRKPVVQWVKSSSLANIRLKGRKKIGILLSPIKTDFEEYTSKSAAVFNTQ
jgi:hypothetical protein